jgi:hypothetical protein
MDKFPEEESGADSRNAFWNGSLSSLSSAPKIPELPMPRPASYEKSIPGTLSVRCRRRGGCLPAQSSSMSRSRSKSNGLIVGSNPNAATFRVLRKDGVPIISRVMIRAPVSLACRTAGLTKGWKIVSPVEIMFDSVIWVSYGAGGSISSSTRM